MDLLIYEVKMIKMIVLSLAFSRFQVLSRLEVLIKFLFFQQLVNLLSYLSKQGFYDLIHLVYRVFRRFGVFQLSFLKAVMFHLHFSLFSSSDYSHQLELILLKL